jgi:hypothetical protein
MSLPAASDFTGGSITEAQFKTSFTYMRTFLAALLGTNEADRVAALTAMGALLCSSSAKTGAYTVVAGDKGKVITCDGTFSLSLTAAATLGDGFAFGVWNTGSGTITIDPSGSELIDLATAKVVTAGKFAIVYCESTKFATVGSMGSADIVAALGYTPVSIDVGAGLIGAIEHLAHGSISVAITAGSTYAGSSLRIFNQHSDSTYSGAMTQVTGTSLSGTWRALTSCAAITGLHSIATFQRIS